MLSKGVAVVQPKRSARARPTCGRQIRPQSDVIRPGPTIRAEHGNGFRPATHGRQSRGHQPADVRGPYAATRSCPASSSMKLCTTRNPVRVWRLRHRRASPAAHRLRWRIRTSKLRDGSERRQQRRHRANQDQIPAAVPQHNAATQSQSHRPSPSWANCLANPPSSLSTIRRTGGPGPRTPPTRRRLCGTRARSASPVLIIRSLEKVAFVMPRCRHTVPHSCREFKGRRRSSG